MALRSGLRPVVTTLHFFFFSFCSFAKTSYVCFVPGGNHLGNALLFHDWKKVQLLVSPPISPFLRCKRLNHFFLPFFPFFWSTTILWVPVVCRIPLSFFVWCHFDKIDLPPLPAAAAPFPCTVIQAFLLSQLSIAACISPDGTFDVDNYRQYAASLLSRARGRSAAILSNMVGGGESHACYLSKVVYWPADKVGHPLIL